MIIIDGKNARLGRLASYVAKVSLKGAEVAVLNCDKVVVTGGKNMVRDRFQVKRRRVGSGQQGPKVSRLPHLIVKRTIRGMLPNARQSGRGKDALGRIKCYSGIPKEFEGKKMISLGDEKDAVFINVSEVYK